jgi:DNA topoisomerase-1
MASVGHVKDLPKSRLGVDVEHGFATQYVVIRGKNKVLDEIKEAARKAKEVYLAPDPDREGEAIAYHIAQEVNGDSDRVYRVLFNEITERAIREAMQHPARIDLQKVNAQQARRVLDRIVGYKISPLLWDKVRRGLSAGRVQSVAVRLVCEREREREAFRSEEYWSVTAQLEGQNPPNFHAKLLRFRGEEVQLHNQAEAERAVEALRAQEFSVREIEKKDRRRSPPPPFITSRLQQEAARRLRFSPKKTMMLAQQLYEGIELGQEGPVGLITYMRTDSVRIAPEAQSEALSYIRGQYGDRYVPAKPPKYKSQKLAQEAHEAIRPTSVQRTPESVRRHLGRDQHLVYKLIWDRFLASQMSAAELELTRVDITAGEHLLRATGTVITFPGFSVLYNEAREEKADEARHEARDEEETHRLPPLQEGERLRLLGLDPKQHFTQPPPRFTEASLIKELEENGIGRPSTYASIMSTIVDRAYVEKEEGRLKPSELGHIVNDLLIQHFPDVLNTEFTAKMEEQLDRIEEGEQDWVAAVQSFYQPFSERLDKAQVEMRDVKREETPTDIVCEKCGRNMAIRWGRNGKFLACPGYPECRNTKDFITQPDGRIQVVVKTEETGERCAKCGSPLLLKRGRFGRFLACSTYPTCDFTKAIGTGVKCPQPGCGGDLVEKRSRRGKTFFACSRYPKCTYAIWNRPLPKPCPQCHAPFLVEKYDKRTGPRIACFNKECGYEETEKAPAEQPAVIPQ